MKKDKQVTLLTKNKILKIQKFFKSLSKDSRNNELDTFKQIFDDYDFKLKINNNSDYLNVKKEFSLTNNNKPILNACILDSENDIQVSIDKNFVNYKKDKIINILNKNYNINEQQINESGFTLIELLAVIVIMAIIAIISIPIVNNVVSKVKESATAEATRGVINAAELHYSKSLFENSQTVEKNYTCQESSCVSDDGEDVIQFKGNIDSGKMIIYANGNVALCITNDEYSASNVDENGKIQENITTLKGSCDGINLINEHDAQISALETTINDAKSKSLGTLNIIKSNNYSSATELNILNDEIYNEISQFKTLLSDSLAASKINIIDLDNDGNNTLDEIVKTASENLGSSDGADDLNNVGVVSLSNIVYLGTGTTFDLSKYDGYTNFTSTNFIIGATEFNASYSGSTSGSCSTGGGSCSGDWNGTCGCNSCSAGGGSCTVTKNYSGTSTGNASFKSYDSSTGTLTLQASNCVPFVYLVY